MSILHILTKIWNTGLDIAKNYSYYITVLGLLFLINVQSSLVMS